MYLNGTDSRNIAILRS